MATTKRIWSLLTRTLSQRFKPSDGEQFLFDLNTTGFALSKSGSPASNPPELAIEKAGGAEFQPTMRFSKRVLLTSPDSMSIPPTARRPNRRGERKVSRTSYTVRATTSLTFCLVTNRTKCFLQKTLPPQPCRDQPPITHTLRRHQQKLFIGLNPSWTYGSDRPFSSRVQDRGKMTEILHLVSAHPCTNLEATVQSPNPCGPPRLCLVRLFPS